MFSFPLRDIFYITEFGNAIDIDGKEK